MLNHHETLRKRRFIPFGYKLMISYVLFLIIPIIVVGYFAYSTFVQSIRAQTSANLAGTLQQMKDNVLYKMNDMKRLSDHLYNDMTLANYIRLYDEDWYSYEATKQYLLPKFQNTIQSTDHDIWLSIYLDSELIPEIYKSLDEIRDPVAGKGHTYDLLHLERIERKNWYRNFPEEQYHATWAWNQIESDSKFGNLSFLRRMVDTNDPIHIRQIGFVRITAKLDDLFDSVDYRKIQEESMILIVDGNHSVKFASMHDGMTGALPPMVQLSRTHLMIQDTIPGLGWTMAAFIPNEVLEKDAKKVRDLTITVCVLCIFLFSFAGALVSKYFSKRVTKIVSVVHSFREGEFHRRFRHTGNDEFEQIASAMNEMGENINQLINQVYLTNLQKKEAELVSLQAQINPHFLYNTLSSINRMSQFDEKEKVQQMVKGLAKFYRLTLNEGRSIIPVELEIEQATTYIAIQKIRFADRFEVSFDIDEEVLTYDTIKLILQPFIENVLEHAWCGDRIHMRIVASLEEGDIIFKIIDDGMGMKREKAEQILDPHIVRPGYGIRNVDERIKLQFGGSYGVSIHSRLGMGTGVRIVVPAYKSDE